ncbi:hypothetical protein VP01_784g3 [Puccinia sorghi]|uniref:Uncharacterized protein n=1 Tax=Puccinia sorghi TaxID=27349 RepID=A0A0L6UD43_9BASI|nr:hypothetical protein VP01_784g3 [Puccinia sorghi]
MILFPEVHPLPEKMDLNIFIHKLIDCWGGGGGGWPWISCLTTIALTAGWYLTNNIWRNEREDDSRIEKLYWKRSLRKIKEPEPFLLIQTSMCQNCFFFLLFSSQNFLPLPSAMNPPRPTHKKLNHLPLQKTYQQHPDLYASLANLMEPLPFSNEARDSQQSWLGPSQNMQDLSHSYHLFHEPGGDTSGQPTNKSGVNIPQSELITRSGTNLSRTTTNKSKKKTGNANSARGPIPSLNVQSTLGTSMFAAQPNHQLFWEVLGVNSKAMCAHCFHFGSGATNFVWLAKKEDWWVLWLTFKLNVLKFIGAPCNHLDNPLLKLNTPFFSLMKVRQEISMFNVLGLLFRSAQERGYKKRKIKPSVDEVSQAEARAEELTENLLASVSRDGACSLVDVDQIQLVLFEEGTKGNLSSGGCGGVCHRVSHRLLVMLNNLFD